MIEIRAKLARGPVYFTNETLKCVVTFKNVAGAAANGHDKRHDDTQMLAWSGVQIHCHCSLDETKVRFAPPPTARNEQSATASRLTSFHPSQEERGYLVFSTKPKILFCDLQLLPNESKTFVYQETIPADAPPSYNGTAVKYTYKLTVGAQRVGSVIQQLRMPIRVLAIDGDTKRHEDSWENKFLEEEEEERVPDEIVTPKNPIVVQQSPTDSKESALDLALHKLDCLTARRCPNTFVITNQLGKVVRFCMLKSAFKIGEDIVGVFNFSEATVPCVQFSVTLQCEEVIAEESRAAKNKSTVNTNNHGKFHQVCLHLKQTQMILPLPLTVTPSFRTNIVSLSWKLHFEFVTTRTEDTLPTAAVDRDGRTQQSPAQLNVQTMVWDLPITVYPTNPIQVARGLQIAATSALVV